MSSVNKMRLIALPLTKRMDTIQPLVYYYAQMPPPSPDAGPKPLLKRGIDKASQTWINLGKAPKDTWKYRVYSAGQRVYKRIDFEELALQSVEPALGPKIVEAGGGEGEKTLDAVQHGEKVTIPLLHSTRFGPPSPLAHLRALVDVRLPSHRRSLIIYLTAIPFTAPFALVPVIPNIPFFFCAWRAWSHWRAYKAADYLSALIKNDVVVPTPSPTLDKLYASITSGPAPETPSILLDDAGVTKLLEAFKLPEDSGTEIRIAVGQAKSRLQAEEKKEAEARKEEAVPEKPVAEKGNKNP